MMYMGGETMHIAICDDEEFFRKSLIEQLNKYSIEKGLDFLYYEYKDGVDLLASKIDFDIIFMDFQMKDKNGIDTVSALRQRNNNTHVIFASSYKDVVFDSLKVKTFRFLIKPIEKEKLYEALNSLIREKSNRFTVLVRNTEQSANYRILERNIIFAQAENVSTLIYASDKCYKYADTLSAFQKELSSDFFFRSHRSFLVNMKYITNYSKNEIIFSTGEKAGFIAVGLQLIFSGINGYCRFTDKYLPLALISSLLSYSLIFACALIFHKKKKRAIYVSAMFLIIDSIMQSLSCIILELFSINYNQTYLTKGVSVIFNIISLLLVTKLQRKRKNMIRSGLKIIPDHLYVLILVALLLSGEMFGCIPIDFERVKIRNNIINFSAVLIVPIFMVLIIYLLFNCISKQYFENISLLMEKQVEQQVEHYKKINKLTDDLREFRHDYKNHMICLQSLLNNKQYDEALSYVKSITNQEILDSNKFFSGNQIADAILTDKNELAQKNNCKIIFDGSVSDEISVSNLCTILSNALDNSIEACSKIDSDETQIIDVKCVASELIQIIRISNPNLDNNAVTETSKADRKNHGFGLSNIRRTVERMDGQMIISSQYPTFVLEIEFKVK